MKRSFWILIVDLNFIGVFSIMFIIPEIIELVNSEDLEIVYYILSAFTGFIYPIAYKKIMLKSLPLQKGTFKVSLFLSIQFIGHFIYYYKNYPQSLNDFMAFSFTISTVLITFLIALIAFFLSFIMVKKIWDFNTDNGNL